MAAKLPPKKNITSVQNVPGLAGSGAQPTVEAVLAKLWATARRTTKLSPQQRKSTCEICKVILQQLGGQFSTISTVNVNVLQNLSDEEIEARKKALIAQMTAKPEKPKRVRVDLTKLVKERHGLNQ